MRLIALGLLLLAAGPSVGQGFAEEVPGGALSRLGTSAFRGEQPLRASFYSADGREVVGCSEFAIRVWDADTGRTLRTFPVAEEPFAFAYGNGQILLAHNPAANAVSFAHFDGRNLQMHIRHWDLATGKMLFERAVDDGWQMEWTPDGTRLVVGQRDREWRLLSVFDAEGQLVRELLLDGDSPDPKSVYGSLCVLDSKRLVMSNRNGRGRVEIFDWQSGDVLRALAADPAPDDLKGTAAAQFGLAAARDGRRIAVIDHSGLKVFDEDGRRTGKIANVGALEGYSPMRFSPDGRQLYIGWHNEGYDVATGKHRGGGFGEKFGSGNVDAVSPDGGRLLLRWERRVEQVAARKGKPTPQCAGHFDIPRIVWLPDCRRILARASKERTWTVWDTAGSLRCPPPSPRMAATSSTPSAATASPSSTRTFPRRKSRRSGCRRRSRRSRSPRTAAA